MQASYNSHPLLNLSPLDGRYAEKLQALRPYLSEYQLMRFRTHVEIEWVLFLLKEKILEDVAFSAEAEQYLMGIAQHFSLADAERIKIIESQTNHDVKAVEYFIKEKMAEHAELKPYQEWVHFACTSEDINNLSYALMLKTMHKEILIPSIYLLQNDLRQMSQHLAAIPMLSRTHGQPASPTTVGKELANVAYRLDRQVRQLECANFLGKFNGAVGNFNAHTIVFPELNWPQLSEKFIQRLGLAVNPLTTQIEPHDYIAEFFHILIRLNTILIDLNRDIWGYISLGYFKQNIIAGEVGSSTMPHKVNPIDFENSEGNLSLANALLDFLAQRLTTSRWQRDLVDSTLLRNLSVAIGHSYLGWQNILKGLKKLKIDETTLRQDLDLHPEILAEAIQTLMRARGHEKAYEQLKALTRGQDLELSSLREFINNLPLAASDKKRLLELSPSDYVGLAEQITLKFLQKN